MSLIKSKFIVAANHTKPLLSIWALNSSDIIQNVKFVLPGKANSLDVSNDGEYLVAGIKENIYIWQISTGKMLTMLSKHYQAVNCVKFIDDGSHFVSGGEDGQVLIWSLSAAIGQRFRTETIEPLHTFSDHALPVTDIFVGVGGLAGILVTASKDRTCKIYDISSGSMLLSLVFQEIITAITFDRLENNLFIGTSIGNIYHHKLQSLPRTREYHITDEDKINNKFNGHTKSITCLATSLDEQTLMSGSEDMNVLIWNIQSRSILKTIPHKGAITNAIFITTPQVMFNREAKLELLTRNFQRMITNSNVDGENDNETIEIMHTNDLRNFDEMKSSNNFYDVGKAPTRNGSSSIDHKRNGNENTEVDNLRLEVERLKRTNKELFDFCAKKSLQKT
jgi:pre-rRNA-processing protein IPI3